MASRVAKEKVQNTVVTDQLSSMSGSALKQGTRWGWKVEME